MLLLSRCFPLKAVPEMSVMVESLQNSREYYEQLKMMEDMLKDGTAAEVTMATNDQ